MSQGTDRTKAHLKITGLVQGVWFRASTRDEAVRLGLVGWVKNCRDGSVEAMAEGPRDKVEEFIRWCRKGPRHARVSDVEVDWKAPTGEFKNFQLTY